MKSKKAVVIHSGGMDSSICLALAIQEFGQKNVLSLSMDYNQRHRIELKAAAKICQQWNVDHEIVPLPFLNQITDNALINKSISLNNLPGQPLNTLVVGRNGLMAHVGGIKAHQLGAHYLYMGIIDVEGNNPGYRDCSRHYMDLKQQILRIDFKDPLFEIRTPLIAMSKQETLHLAHRLDILPFLLKETITCYEGIPGEGCQQCSACKLRANGLRQFKNAEC